MVEPKKENIGKRVMYMKAAKDYDGPIEKGTVAFINAVHVFVKFDNVNHPEGCLPEDLEFDHEPF